MKEPYLSRRRNFLIEVSTKSPIEHDQYKIKARRHTVSSQFLRAMLKLGIVEDTLTTGMIWKVGEVNNAMLDNIIAMENSLIKAGKGEKVDSKRVNPLARYSDQTLLDELKERGFEGSVYKKVTFDI